MTAQDETLLKYSQKEIQSSSSSFSPLDGALHNNILKAKEDDELSGSTNRSMHSTFESKSLTPTDRCTDSKSLERRKSWTLEEKYEKLTKMFEVAEMENVFIQMELEESANQVSELRKEKKRLLDQISKLNESGCESESDGGLVGTSELSSSDDEDFYGNSTKILQRNVRKEKLPSSTKRRKPRATPAKKGAEPSPAPTVPELKVDGEEDDTRTPPPDTLSAKKKPAKPRRTHKRKMPTAVRRVPQYPIDPSTGEPQLPLQLGNITTVISLGRIPSKNQENFHNDRYIWPIGYTVSRSFASMITPQVQTNYLCTISEDPKTGGPIFHIHPEDQPDIPPIEANTATGVWSVVLRAANAIRNKKGLANSVSGPEYYGLSNPIVASLIQSLPGAKYCKDYVWQPFDIQSPAPPGAFPSVPTPVMEFIQKSRHRIPSVGPSHWDHEVDQSVRYEDAPDEDDTSSSTSSLTDLEDDFEDEDTISTSRQNSPTDSPANTLPSSVTSPDTKPNVKRPRDDTASPTHQSSSDALLPTDSNNVESSAKRLKLSVI